MKTTWVYERNGKDYWMKHFIGCSIVMASIFFGIYLSAKQEIEHVDHFVLHDVQDVYHRFGLHNEKEDEVITGRGVPRPENPMPVSSMWENHELIQ